jgi:alkylated DNA repair dioxygenase AlkB
LAPAAAAAAALLAALRLEAVDLEEHRCGAPASAAPGDAAAAAVPRDVFYIPELLSEAVEAAVVAAVAEQPWVQLRGRRLQCHGGTVLPEGTVAEPISPHLQPICTALESAGIFAAAEPPNHVLVNEYAPGEGIMPHRDGPLYHPTVAIISLRSPIVFDFWASAAAASDPAALPARSLLLEPRSLLIFRGDAYTDLHHAISMRAFRTPPSAPVTLDRDPDISAWPSLPCP